MLHKELTEKIIRAYYNVYNELGFGFLEKVYENALLIELRRQGLNAECQISIKVFFDGFEVGNYYADILVNDLVILELKAVSTLVSEHEFQLVNYLRATNKEIGLLLNFGEKAKFKRKIFTNDRKRNFKNQ